MVPITLGAMDTDPKDFPTGIDHLLRRAAHDDAFSAALVQHRGGAETADIVLTDTERQILGAIPEPMLLDMIQSFRDRPSRPYPLRPEHDEMAISGGAAPDMPELRDMQVRRRKTAPIVALWLALGVAGLLLWLVITRF